tara:strand:+ start:2530 stop:2715 length:186 start_codon:yes stop_codon:yes gene_type:complete
MKKIILFTPLAILFSIFSFNTALESAGCSSHKNKNAQVECSSPDDNCDNLKFNKNSKKVDV